MENEECKLSLIPEDECEIRTNDDISEESLIHSGYRKMNTEEMALFNTVFQKIPQIANNIHYAGAIKNSFDAAVQGTYRPEFPVGLFLGKSHTTEGAVKGLVFDINGDLKTHADWLRNNANYNVSMVPQIATSFFNALSFVTGQFFMSQINRKMANLQNDTKSILQFLENDKISTIRARIESLFYIIDHLRFIVKDPERRNQARNDLSVIQGEMLSGLNFYEKQIEDEKQKARMNDKGEIIKEHLRIITDSLDKCRLLTWVYCETVIVEIILNNNVKPVESEELDKYQSKMNKLISNYLNIFDRSDRWMHTYINENYSLNKRPIKQHVFSAAAVGTAGIVNGIFGIPYISTSATGLGTSNIINKGMDDYRKMKKDEHIVYAKKLLDSVSCHHDEMKEPVIAFSRYIEMTKEGVGVIKFGDTMYTNLPEFHS